MEKLYNTYKNVAEFRMIYIREAHAIDGDRPMRGSRNLGIKEHTNFDDRCLTAQRFIDDKSLTMPMLIDDMKNTTDKAYSAKPDRVFLVRSDGRLAVAASRGPFGFKPALEECKQWLEEYNQSGEEIELSAETIAAADKKTAARRKKTSTAEENAAAERGVKNK